MVKVERSECICGKCGTKLSMAWEFEIGQVIDHDNDMGESVIYDGEGLAICPECGNEIQAIFSAEEYPVGMLNGEVRITEVKDSEETGCSGVTAPMMYFYDL